MTLWDFLDKLTFWQWLGLSFLGLTVLVVALEGTADIVRAWSGK